MNRVLVLVIGMVIGVLLGFAVIWTTMPGMMIQVDRSRLSFDETVQSIQQAAADAGWQVPKTYDLRKSLLDNNQGDIGSLRVISLCQPTHAFSILSENDNKPVAGMMPCRIGIYEADGEVYVTRLNIGLMSKMFGGSIADVMGKVSDEEHRMLSAIIAE